MDLTSEGAAKVGNNPQDLDTPMKRYMRAASIATTMPNYSTNPGQAIIQARILVTLAVFGPNMTETEIYDRLQQDNDALGSSVISN